MIVSIVVNLYTTKLLWNVLGIDNYGIFNVVGGIVLMFSFINSAMVASSQRFIAFELGRGNSERLNTTFSVSLVVHFLLAIVILLLAETVGLWFLNTKMNIPIGREIAANWVYQCSIVAFLLTVISVPYNACIVAHEHMKAYGYFGIIEVILKLLIVLCLLLLPSDRLIAYAVLLVLVSLIMRVSYGIYCSRHFKECHFAKFSDRTLMKDMFSFASWSFLGNLGFTLRDQGINIILNLFFNVAVNAAKGVAGSVGGVLSGFSSNFMMAINPQITKRYAQGEIDSMMSLVYQGCKYSLLLTSVVVLPIIVSADLVLNLWLVDVAPFTVGFLQLTLILSLVDCVVSPITTSLQATGVIKKFQIWVSIIMAMSLPAAWLALRFDANPYVVMYVCIGSAIIALAARLILLHELVKFSYRRFIATVYARVIPFLLIAFALDWYIYKFFSQNIYGLIIYGLVSVAIFAILGYLMALTSQERFFINSRLQAILKRI